MRQKHELQIIKVVEYRHAQRSRPLVEDVRVPARLHSIVVIGVVSCIAVGGGLLAVAGGLLVVAGGLPVVAQLYSIVRSVVIVELDQKAQIGGLLVVLLSDIFAVLVASRYRPISDRLNSCTKIVEIVERRLQYENNLMCFASV